MSAATFIPLLIGLALAIQGNAESIDLQSSPTLSVLVYSFRGLPEWVLEGAENEAARILQRAGVGLKWINCSRAGGSAACEFRQAASDLAIRFVLRHCRRRAPPLWL